MATISEKTDIALGPSVMSIIQSPSLFGLGDGKTVPLFAILENMAVTIPQDIEAKWYQALLEEDCLDVMEMLKAFPNLLMVGWDSQPSRQVEGRRRREGSGRIQREWKGRTALHVGASRGCVKLIMQVLELFQFDDFSKINEAHQERLRLVEEFSFSKVKVHPTIKCDLCGIRPIVGDRYISPLNRSYSLCHKCYGSKVGDDEPQFVKIETGLPHGPALKLDPTASTSTRFRDPIEETPGQSPDSFYDVSSNSSWDEVNEFIGVSSHRNAMSQGDLHRRREGTQAAETSDLSSIGPGARRFREGVSTIVQLNRRALISPHKVKDILLAKDGELGLTALAIAALHGNEELMLILRYGIQACEEKNSDDLVERYRKGYPSELAEMRNSLRREIVKMAVQGKVYGEDLEEYYKHRDFNFLPPEEYLFHFLFASKTVNLMTSWTREELRRKEEWTFMKKTKLWEGITLFAEDCELWRFVLQLKDGQGRPPFHVAIDDSMETDFLRVVEPGEFDQEFVVCTLTEPDEVGRTPMYRAAAKGCRKTVEIILENAGKYEEVAATCHAPWRAVAFDSMEELWNTVWNVWGAPLDENFSLKFPFPRTPLHAAIIHGKFDCAQLLIQKWPKKWGDMAYRFVSGVKEAEFYPEKGAMDIVDILSIQKMPSKWGMKDKECIRPACDSTWIWIELDLVELACLVRAPLDFVDFLIRFFEVDLTKPNQPSIIDGNACYEGQNHGNWLGILPEDVVSKHLWHPLHLVACSGRYDMVKYFVMDQKCSPFLEDFEGNSALHHAMRVRELELKTHLLDYVDCEHVHHSWQSDARIAKKQILYDNPVAERQGCINLLLQVGCEVFKTNKRRQLPYPTGTLNDVKFLSWWYSKQQEEYKTTQNDLNFATNAIAVTATLVATASYVGPLQPPMGYDTNQIQYENAWVSIFIVFDTLSFYFAIVAITLSLIPSLPMPQQGMLEELQRTRGMVIWAVGVLLPSIFFVFVAFASSSISVMSANITSEAGGILTILSTILGVCLCLLAFILFGIRLLAFIFPKNTTIRNIYDSSHYVTKFSEQ